MGQERDARREQELMELVRWQVGFGPRYAGADGHTAFQTALAERLSSTPHALLQQRFSIRFLGKRVSCCNYVLHIPGSGTGLTGGQAKGPLLLGTHYDTRPIADRETDEEAQSRPILGANDGGSGTAIQLHMMESFRTSLPPRDVYLVFLDAEDVGNIEGHAFSEGAEYLAAHPLPDRPQEVAILDMVGGRDMILDVESYCLEHEPSRRLTRELFSLAQSLDVGPVTARKAQKAKYIIADHLPFLRRGYPTCLLIDIDYPQWHTHEDLPEAMSGRSLALIEDLLLNWIYLG